MKFFNLIHFCFKADASLLYSLLEHIVYFCVSGFKIIELHSNRMKFVNFNKDMQKKL